MMVRSGGFYHDDDPREPQPLHTVALAIALVIVSAAAIVLVAWVLLLAAGR